MSNRTENLTIRRGDRIMITTEELEIVGTVQLAVNWATPDQPDDWHLSIDEDTGYTFYWDQGIDGGTVKLLHPEDEGLEPPYEEDPEFVAWSAALQAEQPDYGPDNIGLVPPGAGGYAF